jgi:hypothetical protein
MEINYYIFFGTALIPLIVGAIWYNPKVFGSAWMKSANLTEKQVSSGNMPMIFGLVYVFSIFLSAFFVTWSIHQMSVNQLFAMQPGFVDGTDTAMISLVESFNTTYADLHRSFGHGAVHGGIAAVMGALPIISIVALFERRGWKYIMIHFGYWFITFILLSGAVCALA